MRDINVYLVGFMGSGKSTVGKLLAKNLNKGFVDADELLEGKVGISIREIFEKYGEEYFRQIETEIMSEVTKTRGVVVACGGGVVLREENMRLLKSTGIVVYLHVSVEELVRRLLDDEERPLLQVNNRVRRIRSLYRIRLPLYMRYADIIVDNTRKTPREAVQEIMREIRRLRNDSPLIPRECKG